MTTRPLFQDLRSLAIALGLFGGGALPSACASRGGDVAGPRGDGGSAGAGVTNGGGGMTAGAARDCPASGTVVAPQDGFIADFAAGDSGRGTISTQILSFGNGNGVAPSVSTAEHSLQMTVRSPASAQTQYLEVLIAFDTCVDASAFSGVQFSMSGSISGCDLKYGTGDVEHQDVTSGAHYATGPAGAYSPLSSISTSEVTTTKKTPRIAFDDQSYGNPVTPIDKKKLIFAMWQFVVPPAAGDAPSSCIADISVDDVMFFAGR